MGRTADGQFDFLISETRAGYKPAPTYILPDVPYRIPIVKGC